MSDSPDLGIGPFFIRTESGPKLGSVSGAGISVEWATPRQGNRIELFVQRGPRFFADLLLVRAADFPASLRYAKYSTFKSENHQFVFFDALLCGVYESGVNWRPRLEVLRELASLVPLNRPKFHEMPPPGMLSADAEAAGFLLMFVPSYAFRGSMDVEIGWRPCPDHDPMYAAAVSFPARAPELGSGKWNAPDFLGMPKFMLPEIRRLAPDPIDIFSDVGKRFLLSTRQLIRNLVPLEGKQLLTEYAAGQKPREKASRSGHSAANPTTGR
jgi:hypothetical protein